MRYLAISKTVGKNLTVCLSLHLLDKKHLQFIIHPLEKNIATRQFKPPEFKMKDKRFRTQKYTSRTAFQILQILISHTT